MHCGCVRGADTANNVAQNSLALGCFKLYPNDFLISYAKSICILGGKVNVSFCDDNTGIKFNLAARANELAGCGIFQIARFTNRSNDADATSVGSGKLNLSFLTARA